MPDNYDTDFYNWTPPSMEEFRQLKLREEEVRKQGEKRNKQANLFAMLSTAIGGLGGRGGAQMAAQGAQQGVDIVRYENEMKMADLKSDFMNKIQLRQMDMQERQFKMQMDSQKHALETATKIEDARHKLGVQRADILAKAEKTKVDTSIKERSSIADFLAKVGVGAETAAGYLPDAFSNTKKLARIPGKASAKVTEQTGKYKTAEKQRIEQQRISDIDILEDLPEAYGEMRAERGVMTPQEREQYEFNKEYNDIQMETARLNLEKLKKGETITPNAMFDALTYAAYGGEDLETLVPKDTPDRDILIAGAKGAAAQRKAQEVLSRRSMGGGAGGKPPKDIDPWAIWNMKSYTDMTGDEQKFALGYMRNLIKSGDEQSIATIVKRQISQGADKDMINSVLASAFREDPRNPLEETFKMKDIAPSLVQTELLKDAAGNPIQYADYAGDATPQSINAALQAINQSYDMNVEQTPFGFVNKNETARTYRANPAGFVKYLEDKAQAMQPTPEEEIVGPKPKETPIQKGATERKLKVTKDLVINEAKDFLSEEKMQAWGLNEKSILMQLETLEGINEIKSIIVKENGKPYDEETFNKIIAEIKRIATNRIRNMETSFIG